VKVLIEMTAEHYDAFLDRCPDDWPTEFAILKNGMVVNREIEGNERRMTVIYCDEIQAETLLSAARILSVAAEQDIVKALPIHHGCRILEYLFIYLGSYLSSPAPMPVHVSRQQQE
jgi:hypothetical protein